MFIIEDERHAEWQDGRFETRADAITELKRRATIAWDDEPNRAPCTNWKKCGREYVIIEFDTSSEPRRRVSEETALTIDANRTQWHLDQSVGDDQ